MDRVQAMETFRAVVEQRGFARAAERLGLSAASVSRIVADLERSLGVRLLHRTTRTLQATDEGTAYYERCVRILEEIERAELLVRGAHEIPSGTIRVTAPPALGAMSIAPLLPSFHARHPRVRVDLFLSEAVVDLVQERFDLALRFVTSRVDRSFVGRRIVTIENRFVASPAYLAERGAPAHPRDLARHPLILWSARSLPETLIVEGPDGRHEIPVDGPVRTDSSMVQRACALAGMGIAELPDYVVRDDLRSGVLVEAIPGWRTPSLDLWAVMPPAATLAARVRAFVDHVVAGLARGDASRSAGG